MVAQCTYQEVSMAGFRANGLVTLTTDFGSREPFVGIMKGVMLAHAAELRFVDMAHEVSAFQPVEAGFWLSRALRYFPAGTLHVAVVDPGVGTPRDIVVAFVERAGAARARQRAAGAARRARQDRSHHPRRQHAAGAVRRQRLSATFHGRDVFAPLAAAIASGRCDPADSARKSPALNVSGWPDDHAARRRRCRRRDRGASTTSAISSPTSNRPRWSRSAMPTVSCGGLLLPLRRTYGDTQAGEYLGLINSFEVLEVARARGNAAEG